MNERCENCRFWHPVSAVKTGFCKRNQPVVPCEQNHFLRWPVVSKDDWCGEFRASYRVENHDQLVVWVGDWEEASGVSSE